MKRLVLLGRILAVIQAFITLNALGWAVYFTLTAEMGQAAIQAVVLVTLVVLYRRGGWVAMLKGTPPKGVGGLTWASASAPRYVAPRLLTPLVVHSHRCEGPIDQGHYFVQIDGDLYPMILDPTEMGEVASVLLVEGLMHVGLGPRELGRRLENEWSDDPGRFPILGGR